MKATIFFPILCCFASFLHAQLSIDFSNGNFQGWSGDSSKFAVVNGALQLNDNNPTASNQSYLSLPAATTSDVATSWEFFTSLTFSPSTTNFPRIYLSASQSNLSQTLNGYFIQVGGINGDLDALQLCRQDGNNITVLLNGRAGGAGTATVNVRVRVKRSSTGLWTLEADYNGGRSFESEGSTQDQTYSSGAYFGWICRYTATRNKSFSLDDVLIDPLFSDRTAPVLLEVEAQNEQGITLRFNEAVDASTATELNHYDLNPAAGSISSAQRDAANPNNIVLSLSGKMQNLTEYTCTVTGIRDAVGNVAGVQSAKFTYLEIGKAAEGDILISEIMADPTPALGRLPAVEYLELWNKSNKVIALDELQVSNGGTPVRIGTGLFLPNTFLILCAPENVTGFQPFGPVQGVSGFPALTNAGDDVSVRTTTGLVANLVNYDDDWYRDEDKAQGGWALELISASAPADCPGNWRASVDPTGGTPGRINSINNQISDRSGPRLITAVATSAQELLLTFDEPLDPETAEDLKYYALTDGISPLDAVLQSNKTTLRLVLNAPLQNAKAYTLTLAAGIRDCLGNAQSSSQQLLTGVPQVPIAGDLIVNEILFNPATGGSDFVELYNKSQKLISLRGMSLINRQKTSGSIQSSITTDYLLAPGRYVAVAGSKNDIQQRYVVKDSSAIFSNALPSLDDDAGNITLRFNNLTLDSFNYNNKLHSPLLDDEEGISLERLNFDLPTNTAGNWHSAAIAAGGATPGYTNSQVFRPDPTNGAETVFRLEEAKFSPDGDGFQDVLLLPYQTNSPGYLANIIVFDVNGRQVKRLARNESLAAEGILKWDGTTDELLKARVGVYVIWVELFEPGGKKVLQKLSCVLAGRL
ncbi:MAG: Ig-like domain-containing protein [Haliscomenobacter sp.]|uniref:lamin tail domain-containing protein n=1 Tax=Haliscomenobacter sp. TaxID=2717303 RepID=UPI0029A98532|nr:lamin tail domain-containing protein [Haliscomenobacter sp.]MDX2071319.1 Ig-like domain-containing protein [Haliscomenobacter sp.]